MPYLDRILIYPIKSLDPIEVTQASILPGGALAHDREFALVDEQGKVVNAKRTARIHEVRSTYDLAARTVTLWTQGQEQRQTFHLDGDRTKLADWFSQYFGYSITLQQNLQTGFPDDLNAAGPTLVSTASLKQIAIWFPDLTLEEIRHRFRTNLEITDVPSFWEDKLFGDSEQQVPFQIGTVQFWGNNPCQRCIVPTRNPITGELYPGFQQQFVAQRQASLPEWVASSRFNHFYKLTLNTKVLPSEVGKILRIGDKLVKA